MSVSVCFVLEAECSAGLLSRLLQPLARRDLIPGRMRADRDGDMLHVSIALDAVPEDDARLVEGNLRQVVGVRWLRKDLLCGRNWRTHCASSKEAVP